MSSAPPGGSPSGAPAGWTWPRAVLFVSIAYWLAVLFLPPFQDAALNDDWVHAFAAGSFFQDGGISLHAVTVVSLVVQAVWGAAFALLFGPGYGPLRLSTLVLGWGGVLAFCDLLRRDRREAFASQNVIFALIFAFNPLFFVLCPSFMTDVPALALSLMALAASRRAFDGRRPAWRGLLVGSAFAALAYGIRQTAILVPAGLAACYWRQCRLAPRLLWAIWGLPMAAAAVHQLWLHSAHGPSLGAHRWIWEGGVGWAGSWMLAVQRAAAAAVYCGLFSIPAAAAFWCDQPLVRLRRLPRSGWYAAAAALAIVTVFFSCGGWLPYSPAPGDGRLARDLFHECSYISRWGLGCFNINGMGFRPTTFIQSGWFWAALSALSGAALVTLAALAADAPPASARLALLAFGPQFLVSLLSAQFFDRYVLTLVPVALLCGQAAVGRGARSKIALGAVTCLIAAFSWTGTADYLRATAAAWNLGRRAVSAGVPASEVHADLDWCWAHNEDRVAVDYRRRSLAARTPTDETALPCMREPEALVTFKAPARPPFVLMGSEDFFSPLAWRAERLYLYRRAAARSAARTRPDS